MIQENQSITGVFFSNGTKLLHTPVSFSWFSVALDGCVHEVRDCPNVLGYPGCQLMLAAECCHEGRHSALGGRTEPDYY